MFVRPAGNAASGRPAAFRGSVLRDLQRRLRFALFGLLAIMSLHVAAMMTLEGLGFGDAVWLTVTTITTTGYGDLAARTLSGRLATVVLIYFSGIFLLTQAGAAFFELRMIRRERMRRGEWSWGMRDHIVIVNMPVEAPGDWLLRLIEQLRRSHATAARRQTVVLSESFPDGMPAALEDDPDVVQVHGRFDDPHAMLAAGVAEAAVIVVLAEREGERLSDSYTFDVVHRLRERGCGGRIVAECVDDRNRERLMRAGAQAVVRPLRGYPEMIVRAIVAPSSESIVERVFSSQGDECLRFAVRAEGSAWARIAAALIDAGCGTPLGYADPDGVLHVNPGPDELVRCAALFLLVDDRRALREEDVQRVVDRARVAAR